MIQKKIATEAAAGLRGKWVSIKRPGYCLAFVAAAMARAVNPKMSRHNIYAKVMDGVGADLDRSRWAKDMELAFLRRGWAVSTQDYRPAKTDELKHLLSLLKPGDILFSSRSGDKEGHIGIYLGGGLVAENTRAIRGACYLAGSALRETPLDKWDIVTTVGRVPDSFGSLF